MEECARRGQPQRAALATQRGTELQRQLHRTGKVSISLFEEWWALEDKADGLDRFMSAAFKGAVVVERHESQIRYRLPGTEITLADVFEKIEGGKEELGVQEYSVSQTSLEQIFNGFASKQKEETGGAVGIAAISLGVAVPAEDGEPKQAENDPPEPAMP